MATEVNKYLDQAAPWKEIKVDKEAAGTTIYTALRVIDSLKILFAPVLPFTSEKLHIFFGNTEPIFGEQAVEEQQDDLGAHNVLRYFPDKATGSWEPSKIQPGMAFQKPTPLFQKFDNSIVEEERERLRNQTENL